MNDYEREAAQRCFDMAISAAAFAVKGWERYGRTTEQAIAEVLAAVTPEAVAERLAAIKDDEEQRKLEEIVHGPAGAERLRRKREREEYKRVEREIREAGEED